MTTSTIRKNLHKYIDSVDDSFARVMHTMVQEYLSTFNVDSALTEAQEKELDKRIERHKRGESKSYSLAEVKKSLKS